MWRDRKEMETPNGYHSLSLYGGIEGENLNDETSDDHDASRGLQIL